MKAEILKKVKTLKKKIKEKLLNSTLIYMITLNFHCIHRKITYKTNIL